MAGPLAEIYSTVDSAKRRVIDALRNPGLTVEQVLGNANDQAREHLANLADASTEAPLGPKDLAMALRLAQGYNPAGIFIGPESKLWNGNNAFRAANMASKGGDPKEIWTKTGTFKSPDGAWRQEISDADAKLTNRQKDFEGKLHETLSHPTLYEHYPALQYYDAEINSEIALPDHLKKTLVGKGKGTFFEKDFVTGEPKVQAQAFSDDDKQVLIHELQHAIQAKENFSRGGNTEMFQRRDNQIYTEPVLFNAKWLRDTAEKQGVSVDDLWKKQNRGVFNESTLDAAKNPYLDDMYKTAEGGKDPYAAYLRLGGEAEARAAAKRADYSPQMRRDVFPLDDYDVPVDELIMFGNHGPAHKHFIEALRRKK